MDLTGFLNELITAPGVSGGRLALLTSWSGIFGSIQTMCGATPWAAFFAELERGNLCSC